MKRLNISVVTLLLTIITVAQERNYYVEAELAFQRCEYAKAVKLYKIAYAMTGRDTSAKQKLSSECADAQRNAQEQKNLGNIEQAKVLFEKLLEKNSNDAEAKNFISKYTQSAAQCNLGYMYEKGNGVSEDYSEAVRWYREAAEQGYATAQYNLGCMYYGGKGVSKDYTEAIRWFRMAAEQGNARAQYNLGMMYENGIGVSEDVNEAVRWYRKAGEQGIAYAQDRLKNLGEEL